MKNRKQLQRELDALYQKRGRCYFITKRPGHKASKHARIRWKTLDERIMKLEEQLASI